MAILKASLCLYTTDTVVMAEAASKDWAVQSYTEQIESGEWPREGQHILAQYDGDSVVVYQAFCPEIADYAVKHQK